MAWRVGDDRQHAWFAKVFHSGSVAISISTLADGRFLDVNDSFAELAGYRREELIGRSALDLGLWTDPDRREAFAAALRERRPLERFESSIRTKSGTLRHVLSALETLEWDGEPCILAIAIDVSDHKRAEAALEATNARLVQALAELGERERTIAKQAEELRRLNDRLQTVVEELAAAQQQMVQQERLRALGEMASGIAHDFNNALASVVGFSELLLVSPGALEDPLRVRQSLEMIYTGAQDAADVVRRLREFHRPHDPADVLAPVDVNELVKQTVALTTPRWKQQAQAGGRTIYVTTDLYPVPPIVCSESELREALTNLIFNAVDAMPEGGTITIGTRTAGDHVALEVADSGTGMTEDVRRRCLEPFFTTKGKNGTGLGLAMVLGVVGRHDGTLEIDSAPGKGTTIHISLPVQAKPAPATAAEVSPATKGASAALAAADPNHGLRVLVVDDQPMAREVLVAYLTTDGHTAVTATGGAEGLHRFMDERFDLVITDQAMPGMSGEQFAAAIWRAAPCTPVIMVSGLGDVMVASGNRPPGVGAVVGKPVTWSALRQAIDAVLKPE